MTLCLAWKQGSEIYFASDSRLTDGVGGITTDDATKIFEINVKIYGAVRSEAPDEPEPLLHQTTFGLCFAGSYLNGSIIADTIEDVLSNLQGALPYSDFSIDNLMEIAFVVYKRVSEQLMHIHREKGFSEMLIGGYCPETSEFKLYKFSPLVKYPIEFLKEEVKVVGHGILLGDSIATAKARTLLSKINHDYTHFHLLREVIRDDSVPTVGGNIQAGIFKRKRFKTCGIAQYSIYEDEYGYKQVKDEYRFRGLSLDFSNSELSKGNLIVRKVLFNPFESERDEYFKDVFESIDKSVDEQLKKKE